MNHRKRYVDSCLVCRSLYLYDGAYAAKPLFEHSQDNAGDEAVELGTPREQVGKALIDKEGYTKV